MADFFPNEKKTRAVDVDLSGEKIQIQMFDRVDQLPLFPYNRGWETQPTSRGL